MATAGHGRRASLEVHTEQSLEGQDERSLLLSFIKYPEEPVLDVGTGDCACVGSLLAARGKRVVVSEFDRETIRAAENFLKLQGLQQQVKLIQDDITASRLRSGSFLNIVCFNVLHHIGEWPKALAELERILAADGRLIISDYDENGTGFLTQLEKEIYRHFDYVTIYSRPHQRLLAICEK